MRIATFLCVVVMIGVLSGCKKCPPTAPAPADNKGGDVKGADTKQCPPGQPCPAPAATTPAKK